MQMRAAHFVLAAICVAQMTFGVEEHSEGVQVSWNKTPGFALLQDATRVKDATLEACKKACGDEGSCRSFSYRAKDKMCYWSVDSLNFDPDFVMMTKAKTSKEKKYRTFDGLTYRASGWLKVEGQTKDECEAKCTKSNACNALSYRAKDLLCLLSPKAISFAPDFNYYEKKGLVIKTMPLKKEGVAKIQKPADKGAQAANNKAAPRTVKSDKKAVAALMKAENAKLKSANEEVGKSKKIEAEAKKEVEAEKEKVKKEIADAQKKLMRS